jgi:hypothetical protein
MALNSQKRRFPAPPGSYEIEFFTGGKVAAVTKELEVKATVTLSILPPPHSSSGVM